MRGAVCWGVHYIIYEGTSEEKTHPSPGLDLCGDRDLESVSPGDTVWVVTRMGGARGLPGLCGRLTAAGVAPHLRGDAEFDETHSDCRYLLLVDEVRSTRCEPIRCDAIVSWDIWRRPFRGVRPLTDEQGRTLEAEWGRGDRRDR